MSAKKTEKKRLSLQRHYLKEHHFLFIEKPFQEIAGGILQWGWSSWWPKDGCVQYTVAKDANFGVGVECWVVVKCGLFRIRFKGEIVQIKEKRALQIEWKSGLMRGQEFVIVEERSNGARVDHRVRYRGANILTRILWLLFFRQRYQEGIQQGMDALKASMEE